MVRIVRIPLPMRNDSGGIAYAQWHVVVYGECRLLGIIKGDYSPVGGGFCILVEVDDALDDGSTPGWRHWALDNRATASEAVITITAVIGDSFCPSDLSHFYLGAFWDGRPQPVTVFGKFEESSLWFDDSQGRTGQNAGRVAPAPSLARPPGRTVILGEDDGLSDG